MKYLLIANGIRQTLYDLYVMPMAPPPSVQPSLAEALHMNIKGFPIWYICIAYGTASASASAGTGTLPEATATAGASAAYTTSTGTTTSNVAAP